MKLILKEDIEDLNIEEPNEEFEINAPLDIEVNEPIPEETEDTLFVDETDPKLAQFITSDALNELRDIIVELPEDIFLLLLDNKAVVIARVDENNDNYLYCLGEDDDELSLVKMPMKLEEILANNQIIQYTPANVSSVHDKVVELFAKELQPEEEETIEEPMEEIPEEPIDDIPNEEGEEEYEEDEVNP